MMQATPTNYSSMYGRIAESVGELPSKAMGGAQAGMALGKTIDDVRKAQKDKKLFEQYKQAAFEEMKGRFTDVKDYEKTVRILNTAPDMDAFAKWLARYVKVDEYVKEQNEKNDKTVVRWFAEGLPTEGYDDKYIEDNKKREQEAAGKKQLELASEQQTRGVAQREAISGTQQPLSQMVKEYTGAMPEELSPLQKEKLKLEKQKEQRRNESLRSGKTEEKPKDNQQRLSKVNTDLTKAIQIYDPTSSQMSDGINLLELYYQSDLMADDPTLTYNDAVASARETIGKMSNEGIKKEIIKIKRIDEDVAKNPGFWSKSWEKVKGFVTGQPSGSTVSGRASMQTQPQQQTETPEQRKARLRASLQGR